MITALVIWILLLNANIYLLNKESKTLQKQMLEVRSKIRRREAGQTWKEIAKTDQQKSVDNFYAGIDDT